MRITKQTTYCTLAVLFLLIAVVCGYLLLDSQHQKDEGRSAFRELASAVNEAQTTKQEAPDEPPAETENSLLAVYRALAEQNADMVGWIRIEGTTIDYPVMQTPDDFNFYLRRNFDKSTAISVRRIFKRTVISRRVTTSFSTVIICWTAGCSAI